MFKELKREIGLMMVLVMLAGCFEPLGIRAEGVGETSIADASYENADEEMITEESGDDGDGIETLSSAGLITYTGGFKGVGKVTNDLYTLQVSGVGIPFADATFTATFPETEADDDCEYEWTASGIDTDYAKHDSNNRLANKYKKKGWSYYPDQSGWNDLFYSYGRWNMYASVSGNKVILNSEYGLSDQINNSRVRLWADCINKTKNTRHTMYIDLNIKIQKVSGDICHLGNLGMQDDMKLLDESNEINSKDNPYVINCDQGDYISKEFAFNMIYKQYEGQTVDCTYYVAPRWLLFYKLPGQDKYTGVSRGGPVFRYLDNREYINRPYIGIYISGGVDFSETTDFILRAVSPDDDNIFQYMEDPEYVPDPDNSIVEYKDVYFRIVVKPVTLSGIGIYDYSTSYVSEIGYQREPLIYQYDNGTDICRETSIQDPAVLSFTLGEETAFRYNLETLFNKQDGSRSYFDEPDLLWDLTGYKADGNVDDSVVYCEHDKDTGEPVSWVNYDIFNGIKIAFDDEAEKTADGGYKTGSYKSAYVSFVGNPTDVGEKLFKLTAYGRITNRETGKREEKSAWIKIVVKDQDIMPVTDDITGTAEITRVYTAEPDEEVYRNIPMRNYVLKLKQGEAFGNVRFEAGIGGDNCEYDWAVTRDDSKLYSWDIISGYKDSYFDDLFTDKGFNGIKAKTEGNSITFSSAAVGGYPNNIKLRLWVVCRDKDDKDASPVVVRRDVLLQIEKNATDMYKVDEITGPEEMLLDPQKPNSPENPFVLCYEQGDYISSVGILASYGASFGSKLYKLVGNNKEYPGENEEIYPGWAVYSYSCNCYGDKTYRGLGNFKIYDDDGDYYTANAYWSTYLPHLETNYNNKLGSMPSYEFKGKNISQTTDFMLRAYSPDCNDMAKPGNVYTNDDDPNGMYKNVFVRVEAKKAKLSDITVNGVENTAANDGSTPDKAIEIRMKEGAELKNGNIKIAAALINSRGKDIASPYEGYTHYYDDQYDWHGVSITCYTNVPYWYVEEYIAGEENKPKDKYNRTPRFTSEDEDYGYELYKGVRLVFGDTARYIDKYYVTGRSDERFISFTGKPEGKGEKIYKVTASANGEKKTLYFKLVVGDVGEPEPETHTEPDPEPEPSIWPETETGWFAAYDYELSGTDMVIKKLKKESKPGEYAVIPAKAEKDGKSYNVVLKGDMIWGTAADTIKGIKIEKGVKALNTESASGLFEQMEALETLDITGMDTSAMTSMRDMFAGCKKLKTLDLSGLNTAAVTDMGSMFEACESLEEIDVSKFNTSKLEAMDLMFNGCKSLKKLDLSKFDMSQVEETEADELFVKGCAKLEELYLPASVLGAEFDGAKAGLTALKTVYYAGSIEEWRETRCTLPENVKLILKYGTNEQGEAPAPGEAETAMSPVPVITAETKELHLVKGQKFTLKNNDFTSADPKTVSINPKGQLSAKKETKNGPILLTKSDASQIIKVYVYKPAIQKSIKLEAGESKTPTFDFDSNLYVTWESSAPDVAVVDSNGKVTAIAKGSATITANINGKAYKCSVKVTEKATPEERELHINAGKTKKITVKGMSKPGWISDNKETVDISGTKFIAKVAGKATVTSADGKYKVTVYVEDPKIVSEGFTVKKGKYNIEMKGGDNKAVKFAKLYRNVQWKSSKPDKAFVDEDGYIRARANGKTKLTTKINGTTVTINVTVKGNAPDPAVSGNAAAKSTL